MKIKFKIPEWAIGKHIYIFAGNELLGEKQARIIHNNKGEHVLQYLPLKIKSNEGRCNGCGACCQSGSPFNNIEEACPYLTNDGCKLGKNIPFSCARSVCTAYEGCTEKLEDVR